MLSFLFPGFLIGAAAAAVPLVLHLLRREPEPRVKFPAVKLLKQAPVERTEKRHLRELILLALRIASLVLLALAFARPFFANGAALTTSGTTIVALDTSYSMSAPGRFSRAQQLARAAIDRAPANDLVGVVAFADRADVLARPSADRTLTRGAVDAASAGFGTTRYRAGLNAAAQALQGRRGTIVVVTDLQESGWDAGERAIVPENARIEIADVGAMPANLAVTGLRAASDHIVATIHNAGPSRQARVHLFLDGAASGDATIALPANGSADAPLPPAGRAETAMVRVEDQDGLQADNARYLVVGGAARPSILLITGSGDAGQEAFYLQHALAAGDFDIVSIGAAQLSAWDAPRLAGESAVLLVSTRGLERRGREALASYVERGGGVLIAAGPDVDGDVAADVLGADVPLRITAEAASPKSELRTLAPADVRHPVFRAFDPGAATLGLVRFRTVSRIAGTGCQGVARFTTSELALIDCAAGEGRGLVFASDLDNRWNDFPLHPTFVPFVHEIVRYLSSAHPVSAESIVGADARLPLVPGVATIPADARSGARARKVAVNVDPREGEPTRISADDFQTAVTRLQAASAADARVEATQQEDRQHLWRIAIVLMIAALAVEGLVASRTA